MSAINIAITLSGDLVLCFYLTTIAFAGWAVTKYMKYEESKGASVYQIIGVSGNNGEEEEDEEHSQSGEEEEEKEKGETPSVEGEDKPAVHSDESGGDDS